MEDSDAEDENQILIFEYETTAQWIDRVGKIYVNANFLKSFSFAQSHNKCIYIPVKGCKGATNWI